MKILSLFDRDRRSEVKRCNICIIRILTQEFLLLTKAAFVSEHEKITKDL